MGMGIALRGKKGFYAISVAFCQAEKLLNITDTHRRS
jgi:hypothetical protein